VKTSLRNSIVIKWLASNLTPKENRMWEYSFEEKIERIVLTRQQNRSKKRGKFSIIGQRKKVIIPGRLRWDNPTAVSERDVN
jgi:hypothetical protein